MAGQQVSIKQAFIMIYDELAEITLPANQFLTAGVRVGNALQIARDCIDSLEQEERAAYEAAQAAQAKKQEKTPAETATERIVMDGFVGDAADPDGKNMKHDFEPLRTEYGNVE